MTTATHHRAAYLLALTLVLACVPPVATATSYKTLPPKASADDVEVFTDVRPERAHEELGVIDVTSSPLALKSDYGPLIQEARQRAAKMGADAIIVSRSPVEQTTTTGHVTPTRGRKGGTYTESKSTSERARITVVAITWKAGQ